VDHQRRPGVAVTDGGPGDRQWRQLTAAVPLLVPLSDDEDEDAAAAAAAAAAVVILAAASPPSRFIDGVDNPLRRRGRTPTDRSPEYRDCRGPGRIGGSSKVLLLLPPWQLGTALAVAAAVLQSYRSACDVWLSTQMCSD